MTDQSDENPPAGASTEAPGPAAPVRLLLVDDSRTNRMLALSILKKMGYRVDAVDSGEAAVAAVGQGDYRAVLMDVWMPEMDGLMATAAIRALPAPACDIPIIAMTADSDDEDRRRCLAAGMNDYLSKPIDRKILAAVLARATGQSGDGSQTAQAASGAASLVRVGLIDEPVFAQLREDTGPETMADLVVAFMAETDERVVRMTAAAGSGDLAAVYEDAHALKATTGQFGARRLNAVVASILVAANNRNQDTAERLLAGIGEIAAETWRAFADRGIRVPAR